MSDRATRILDANYKKNDINTYFNEECTDLSDKQSKKLKDIITKYEILFDWILGRWKRDPISFNQKPNAKLVQSRLF